LWLAATLGNPVFLVAVVLLASQWDCLAGRSNAVDCVGAIVMATVAVLCCLTPCAGLMLRWRSWRRA
jgi:hypothetical protein